MGCCLRTIYTNKQAPLWGNLAKQVELHESTLHDLIRDAHTFLQRYDVCKHCNSLAFQGIALSTMRLLERGKQHGVQLAALPRSTKRISTACF